jgi:hypothetical protein
VAGDEVGLPLGGVVGDPLGGVVVGAGAVVVGVGLAAATYRVICWSRPAAVPAIGSKR